jgi:hypothetical protein
MFPIKKGRKQRTRKYLELRAKLEKELSKYQGIMLLSSALLYGLSIDRYYFQPFVYGMLFGIPVESRQLPC